MNPRITTKERGLIKGALRRVFSRSDMRRQAIASSVVNHTDTSRPRVKTWCLCPSCKGFIPKSYMQVDHITPIIGLQETLEDLTWDEVVDRLWCEYTNLKAICTECHKAKTKDENKARRAARKAKHGDGSKENKLHSRNPRRSNAKSRRIR